MIITFCSKSRMWGARANGWPEGKHLMLASNDPLVHWHLRSWPTSGIQSPTFISSWKTSWMVTAMLLLCVMHMHDVCSMYLSLFAFLTLLMRSPIDMPYRKCNPSRDSHTAVEHDIKVAVSYNKKEPKVSSKYLAGILMDFFLGKNKLKPLSFPNPMMDSIILNSVLYVDGSTLFIMSTFTASNWQECLRNVKKQRVEREQNTFSFQTWFQRQER